jgi:hypothetical protein
MKIRHGKEEIWTLGLQNNQDFYGRGVYDFAKRWAELLEKDIDETGNAEDAIVLYAEQRSGEADTDGITGFMYGCAVAILANVWEYGEFLRKWHNKEYDYAGSGVVNPAILTIRSKG